MKCPPVFLDKKRKYATVKEALKNRKPGEDIFVTLRIPRMKKTSWRKDLKSLLFDFADGYYAKGIGKGKLSEKDYWKRVNDWCKRLFYPLFSEGLKEMGKALRMKETNLSDRGGDNLDMPKKQQEQHIFWTRGYNQAVKEFNQAIDDYLNQND